MVRRTLYVKGKRIEILSMFVMSTLEEDYGIL
jgi:hypothetical protein